MRRVGGGRALAIGAVAAVSAGAALCSPFGASASPASAPAPATSATMVPIAASLHPLAQPSAEAGRMDPDLRLSDVSLLFRMSPRQKSASAALQIALQDPTSPRYHQWLTPEQFAAQFGASPADVARASDWLRSQGLTVVGPSRTSTRLSFSGTVAQIEQAFRTELHHYLVDGVRHFAMSIAPSVPADLASLVLGVHNLHDFRPRPPAHPTYSLPLPGPDGGLVDYPTMAPADFAKIYSLDSLYAKQITGTGQHIAIAGQTDFTDADIASFRSTFNLSATGPTRHLVPGTGNAYISQGDITESELDLEWSGAVAPDATIDFVFSGDNPQSSVFDAMAYAIEEHIAPIVSVSYGGGESSLTPSDAVFNEALGDAAALTGITVLAAAGDTGPAEADSQHSKAAKHGEVVDWPASIPTFVAVGGTQFQLTMSNLSTYLDANYNALGYIPESGWNETFTDEDAGVGGLGASGGGVSQIFAKPYWQVLLTPNDGFRDVPDVALSASAAIYPYVVSYSGVAAGGDAGAPPSLTAIGGTSAAAPSFAGILALVNQALATANPSAPVGLGNANPILYALAGNPATQGAFNQITTGNNIVPCTEGSPSCPASPPYQFGYSCGPGYNQVTGLGSINASALVAAWTTLKPTATALVVTETGATEGSPLALKATVASTATSTALTGSVTFYFETFDSMGNMDLSGVLGSAAIVPSTSGNEGGTAQLTAKAPAGLLQADAGLSGGAKIGAIYGGDIHYLASWSALSQVSATSSLAICPGALTLQPLQTGFQFQATGGTPPISWAIYDDTTCARETVTLPDGGTTHQEVCSSITDTGVYTAGPAAGVAQVIAYDSNDAYTSAYVTVSADAGATLPSPCPPPVMDAGPGDAGDAGEPGDAGADAAGPPPDAAADGGPTGESGPAGGGCGCVTAGAEDGAALAGLQVALLGLFAMARRKRSRAG
jgi:hypothetical protein